MAKFAVFFQFKGETIKRLIENPGDRPGVVRKLAESVGGEMESYYLMFGQWDGFVVVSAPDSQSAAALSLAVAASGAFQHLETHELVDPLDLPAIAHKAHSAAYTPPGS
jgi:uncharacterized protein with GYD domain